MSDDTDFIALYEELGIGAGCGMDEFKRAYRRRVAQLHPDHPSGSADMPRLQRVNRQYDAALEFHRVHGRLPGAPARARTRPVPAAASFTHQASEPPADAAPVAGNARYRRYLMWLAVLCALLWLLTSHDGVVSLDPDGPGDAVAPGLPVSPQASRLALGMDAKLARRILGEPDGEHAARWDYGPSWVEIQCGRIIGWYSSPLRPLKVDEASVQAAAGDVPRC